MDQAALGTHWSLTGKSWLCTCPAHTTEGEELAAADGHCEVPVGLPAPAHMRNRRSPPSAVLAAGSSMDTLRQGEGTPFLFLVAEST